MGPFLKRNSDLGRCYKINIRLNTVRTLARIFHILLVFTHETSFYALQSLHENRIQFLEDLSGIQS